MAGLDVTEGKRSGDDLTTADAVSQAFVARSSSWKRTWSRLAWLPIPLLLITMLVLVTADPRGSHESPHLLLALNFAFSTLVSLFVAYLIGRSYLVRSTPGMLIMGCGVLFWGAAFVLAAIGPANANFTATVHNLGVWLSAVCNLAGASLLFRPRRTMPSAGLWLGWAYTLALGTAGFVALGVHAGWTPVFFIQGLGGTPIRQLVLGSAVTMLVLAAILLRTANRKSVSAFEHWYPYALGLMAVGLLGVLIQSSLGSWLSWAGRAAQYLGGVYMLIAAIASVRESHAWGISLEAALQESEGRFRVLFNTMSEGFALHEIVTDDQGQPCDYEFIDVNPAFEQLTGLKRTDLIGKRIREVLPSIESHWIEDYGKVALTGEPLHQENFSVGLKRWYEVFAYRPAPHRFAVIFSDITERKRVEEALRESGERFELAVRASRDIVWDWDIVNDRVWFSDRFFEIFGYNRATFPSGANGWAELVHPDDNWVIPFEEQTYTSAEYRLRRADGTWAYVCDRKYLVRDAAGKPIRKIGVMMDISESKEAQEALQTSQKRLAAIIGSAMDAIITLDADERIVVFNAAAEEIFGCSAAEAIGHSLRSFSPGEVSASSP